MKQMPLLQFMPWCPIDKVYSVGDVTIIPFHCDESIQGLDELATSQVKTILASYRDLEGQPIKEAALIQYQSCPLLADLSDDEIEVTRECVELACFCSLAKRDYFSQEGPYSNTDCFIVYGHEFSQAPRFFGITTRRREGRTRDGRWIERTMFSIPVHVSPIGRVSLYAPLLDALVAFRNLASDDAWIRWQNAISCFNQANTDNDAVRYQVEWVLLSSAFEHILEAKSNCGDVARTFTDLLVPYTQLFVRDTKRRSDRWSDADRPLRYEWMKEFYRIRGDFAHGRLKTRQAAVWNALEHIVLASIAFPLLTRCLLERRGIYGLTDNDRSQINVFERLADEQFLNPPEDQKSSIDSTWWRLQKEEQSALLWRELAAKLEASCSENDEREAAGSGEATA
jgi:hypothetical protein